MKTNRLSTQDIAYISLGAVIMIICSWICIPTIIPFTMQSFGIILVCLVLGTKRSFFSLLVYFFLGMAGLPVFAGFKSGISTLAGPTGGYVLGMLFLPIIIGRFSSKNKLNFCRALLYSSAGMIFLYIFGTLWYSLMYVTGKDGILSALTLCVFPFIIPDFIKCIFAIICAIKIKNRVLFH